MHELVSLLCASAIELRSGRLTAETFRRKDLLHHMRLNADKPDETAKAVQEIFQKYPTVRFDSTLLEQDVVVEFILKSKLPMSRIQRQLKQHPYFAKTGEMPSWRALWLSSEAPVREHEDIVRRFEADFDARTFRAEAEINHVIGLSLWLSEMGLPGWEETGVVEKVKRYISDIYSGGAASPDEMRESTLDSIRRGAFGLGYTNSQDPRFGELTRYQHQQRAAWRQRAYPGIAARLHRLMTEDSEAFLRDVCFTAGGPARFAGVGVLKHIPADQFAATMVDAPYRDQKEVAMALYLRYEQATSKPELEGEIPWLKDVQQQIAKLSENSPPIARFHQRLLIQEYVDKVITEVDARSRDKYPSGAGVGAAPEQDES